MSNLKLVSSFLKIRFHNIGTLLLKTATTYAVGGFAAIQLSSIVVDNVSDINFERPKLKFSEAEMKSVSDLIKSAI